MEHTTTEILGPFLTNTFGDRFFYSINRDAFNKIGAEALFQRHFGQSLFRENSLTVIIGTDSGLLPRFIAARGLPEGARYLFVELPEVMTRLHQAGVLEGLDDRIILATYDNWREQAEACRLTDYVFLANIRSTLSIGAEDGNHSGYHGLGRKVREELERLTWERNAQLGNEAFFIKQIENLAENRSPLSQLRGTAAGATAVILGGGPSLDEVLPWLKTNRDKLVIFAVSRIARRLLEVGFEPHIVVSIDPHAVSFDVSKEMLRFGERTLFINHYHTSSALLGQWRGRSLFMGQPLPWESPLNRDFTPSPGPTVTNAALAAAVELGFAEILLAGVDLCFSRSGHTHALGSNEHHAGPQLGRGQSWVETNGGWQAETSHDFAAAVHQLDYQAAMAAKRGIRVINLAQGAARMANVVYSPVAEFKLVSPPIPVFDRLLSSLPEETAQTRCDHYRTLLDELNRATVYLKKIKKLACDALDANDGLFGRKGKTADFKYKKRMDKIEKRLNSDFGDFAVLVKKFGIRHFLKMTRPDRDKEWSDEEVETAGRLYYEAYRDSAERLSGLVEEARMRVQTRIEEEMPAPSAQRLFAQWRKDGQPGRALVWRVRNFQATASLSAKDADQLIELEKEFEAILGLQETEHFRRSRKFSDLGQVRGKALTMFKRREETLLVQLIEGLNGVDRPEAIGLRQLCNGYLAELQDDPSLALESYQALMEQETGALVEDALRRVAAISLDGEHFEDARLALECLSGISPIYLPQYGDLLRLMGEMPAALDAYADYLEKVPDDLAAMLKLGRYYLELNIPDGARLMFSSVLEKDPQNQAAKTLLSQVLG